MKARKTKHAELVFPVCKSHHIIVTDKSITQFKISTINEFRKS